MAEPPRSCNAYLYEMVCVYTTNGVKTDGRFKISLEWVHHVVASPSAVTTSALSTHKPEEAPTKDMREDVIHATAASAAFSQALLSIPVVQFFLLWVGQDFVGEADLLELKCQAKISVMEYS